MIKFEKIKSFGLGMDLSWNSREGFFRDQTSYKLTPELKKFLQKNEKSFDHFFFSLQPMDFNLLFSDRTLECYFRAFDELLNTAQSELVLRKNRKNC